VAALGKELQAERGRAASLEDECQHQHARACQLLDSLSREQGRCSALQRQADQVGALIRG
jgi:hypothetical protein